MEVLGFGVPNWPRPGPSSHDWSPLVLPAIAILVGAWPFGLRLTRRSVIALAVGGTLTAWLAAVVGLMTAVALGVLALAVGSSVSRRRPRPNRNRAPSGAEDGPER
jgi:hypothetical protein